MPIPAAAEPSFGALAASYVEHLEEHHRSLSAQKLALVVLPFFFSHLREEGVTDVRGVFEVHLVSFARALAKARAKRRSTPFTISSQRSYMLTVRGFFAWLQKRGVILSDPAAVLPIVKDDVLPRAVLTEAEARCLVTAPSYDNPRWWAVPLSVRDKAILELLYGTGIRLSECVRLDVSGLDLLHGTLFVRDGKGRKDRVVPVTGAAALALDHYLTEVRPLFLRDPREAGLFLTAQGKRLSSVAVDQLIRRHVPAAKVPRVVSAHSLRHACATHLLRGGADVRHVQRLLGHKSLTTTARYTRVVIADLRRMIERSHPRERLWIRQALQSKARSDDDNGGQGGLRERGLQTQGARRSRRACRSRGADPDDNAAA